MKHLSLLVIFIFIFVQIYGQKGYWDALRTQKKEVKLVANTRVVYSLDIPYGTTQLIYRITVLDINSQIPNQLSALVGQFNSPSALAAASALSLTSVIMGKDKCKYFVFKNQQDASNYAKTGIPQNSCHGISQPLTTDNGYFNNDKCISIYANRLFFGIETTNLSLPSNIIIEIAPWVEPDKERGWTKEATSTIQDALAEDYNEDLLDCMMSKITEDYTVIELSKIKATDEKRILDGYAHKCLDELGISKEINDEVDNEDRAEADSLIDAGNYSDAIDIYLVLDDEKAANYEDYNSLGWCYLLTKQYLKAIKYLKKGEEIEETSLLIKGNLAHAYLLNGEFEKANLIYQKYVGQNIDEEMSWVEMVKGDFDTFKKKGISSPKFSEIINSFEAPKE